MSPDEIQVALQAAFYRCDAASCPLTDTQKEILLQVVEKVKGNSQLDVSDVLNPLDELTQEEIHALLEFVKSQEEQNLSWKAQLLNDWLLENDSGAVQFIRDRYGLQWLNRVEDCHFQKYVYEDAPKLRVGDRIEVCNALWEWVQDDGPCSRQWYKCTIIRIDETNDSSGSSTNCIIRFNTGEEYEIQGIYEWNRYYWRIGE
ncbi:hypothetical protein WA1_20910 [Scytonema hofmannii PCC 7110]|uniref:Uncharacterized protein n=1 Tax=Scytonema hofmannii PCC 7110 TaxID=128403 RepID=A0A139XCK5_9CYAN|nr:hypothetical protein [Scytonema hofmannii]KYC42428.1 hypothetical protein WA1_20910 [Scytonema hofmannii PCC 7110]